MSEVIKVTKPGIDAISGTAGTVPNNIVFSSDYNTLKYYANGTASLTVVAPGTANGTLAHNLGYHPFVIAYVNDLSGTTLYQAVPYENNTFTTQRYASVYSDSTNLYFQLIHTGSGTYTAYFSYKLFKNDLGF